MKTRSFTVSVHVLGVLCLISGGCNRNPGNGPEAPAGLYPPQEQVELIAPYNGLGGIGMSSTFWWQETPESEQYHLQISTDLSFSDLVYDEPGVTGHLIGHDGFELSTDYFWRVRAVNRKGEGPWSAVWRFSTGDGSLPLPLEGTWRFLHGDYHPSEGILYYGGHVWIEVWGDALISFGGGLIHIEGNRGVNRYGEWSDTTYSGYVVEEGSYTQNGSSLNLVLPSLIDPLLTGMTRAEYHTASDTLVISYLPTWCGPWNSWNMEGQLLFRK